MTASSNLELVRWMYANWERGDFGSTEWADPEIEWVMAGGPAPGRSTGVAGMAVSFGDFLDAWDQYRIDVDEYRELDDERILVLIRLSGRGRTSGVELGELGAKAAHLFHVRGRKVTRLVIYWDRERALADLGLAPEDGSQ